MSICPTCGADRDLQSADATPEQPLCDVHVVLTRTQLADLLQVSVGQVDFYRRAKTHPAIKQLDGPGHPRFCRQTAAAWLAGRISTMPKSRRYFGRKVS